MQRNNDYSLIPDFMIQARNISKSFFNGRVRVLDNISFGIPKGCVVSIVGPNGCGKSTILNILARISSPDSGDVQVNSASSAMSHDLLRISYIMQNSDQSLFPWKTAWDNIAFPLELGNSRSNKRKERRLAAKELVVELGLADILTDLNRYPYELSGGQKQACNIARAIMHQPDLLLMDEPFASLDYETKISLEDRLLEILHRKRLTCVLVSHDIEDAVYLSDIIMILGRKPTHIAGVVETHFELTRKRTLLTSEQFFRTRNQVLELLKANFEL